MEWAKFTAWPWLRDHAFPAVGEGCKAWFDETMEHPGVAAFNVILGALIASLIAV